MKQNKYTLIFLSGIVISSLTILLFIQFLIVRKNIQNNRNTIEMSIPDILSELYDNMVFNFDLKRFTSDYKGTGDFTFHSDELLTDSLQIILRDGIDEAEPAEEVTVNTDFDDDLAYRGRLAGHFWADDNKRVFQFLQRKTHSTIAWNEIKAFQPYDFL